MVTTKNHYAENKVNGSITEDKNLVIFMYNWNSLKGISLMEAKIDDGRDWIIDMIAVLW